MASETENAVDHKTLAQAAVSWAEVTAVDANGEHAANLAEAQAHATLAVADQLERLNDKLGDPGADFGGFLDLLREDIRNIVWHNTGGGR